MGGILNHKKPICQRTIALKQDTILWRETYVKKISNKMFGSSGNCCTFAPNMPPPLPVRTAQLGGQFIFIVQ
jgi:hypothetical protein